jgi:O-antigen/teichoic acid export membrane protein
VNIIFNIALIPRLGITGAAISTTISYILLALLMARFSRRFRNVPYEWARMMKAAGVALLLVLASFSLHHSGWFPPGFQRPLADVFLFLLFLPGLYVARFFREAEVARARTVFSRLAGRAGGARER